MPNCVCDTSIAVITAEGNCIKCGSAEIVVENRCVHCQIVSPGCATCASDATCTACLDGYYLSGDKCYQQCPLYYYENPEQSSCEQCPEGCVECSQGYFDGADSPPQASCHSCKD